MKKIDVHAHLSMFEGAVMRPGVIYSTPEQLIKLYDEYNIEKGFVMPLISPECRFHIQNNEEMEYVSNNNPDRIGWFCNIDPRMGNNNSKTEKSAGVKILFELNPNCVDEYKAYIAHKDDPICGDSH